MQTLLLAKVESAAQASTVSALAGQTATVSKVSAVTKLATLTPIASGQAPIVVKLDAARQVAEMQALVGKTVAIGKSPAALGGIGNWISLSPVASAKAGGVAAGAVETSRMVMMKVDGIGAAKLPALAGKTFTVAQPPVAAGTKAAGMLYLNPTGGGDLVALTLQDALPQTGSLVGKTFTVAPSPAVGGAGGKFLVLKPMSATVAKAGSAFSVKLVPAAATGASGATAAKAGGAFGVKFVPAATGAGGATTAAGAGSAAALVATGAGTVNPLTAATAGSSILSAKGISLGLGLGLGAWGPVALGVAGIVGAATLYAWARRRHGSPDVSDDMLLAAAIEE